MKIRFSSLSSEAQEIISNYRNTSKISLMADDFLILVDAEIILLEKLANGVPVGHIVGYTWIQDYKIKTPKPLLVPRPETEFWFLNFALKEIINCKTIADLCCGTGILGVLAKKNLKELNKIQFVDYNPLALEISKINYNDLFNEDNNEYILNENNQDYITWWNKISEKPDIILCNPPYLDIEKFSLVKNNSEDNNALFAEDKGLFPYKNIINVLIKEKWHGKIFFEIDPSLSEWFNENSNKFIEYDFFTDQNGRNRAVKICL